jgi:hypothetical protein
MGIYNDVSQNENQKREDIVKTIAAIDGLIRLRNRYLIAYERLLMRFVLRQQITLLNCASRRKIAMISSRTNGILQVEVRILRRNLFLLRDRKNRLVVELDALSVPSNAGVEQTVQSSSEATSPEASPGLSESLQAS